MIRCPLILLCLAGGLAACTPDAPPAAEAEELAALKREVVQIRAELHEAQVRIEELEKAAGLAPTPDADEAVAAAEGDVPLTGPEEALLKLSPLPPEEPVVALAERERSPRRAWKWTRLSRHQVAETVRDNALAIHGCISPLLGHGAKAGASVDLRFRIVRSGRAEQVRLGDLPDGRADCLRDVFAAMRFPRFSGKTMRVDRLPLSLQWKPADPESAMVLEDEIEISQRR